MSKRYLMDRSKKEGESSSRFRSCVPPCGRYMVPGDTHDLCVVCLEAEHARSALEGADCVHCELLPMHLLHSRKALFDAKGAFTSVSRGAGPTAAEAERRQHSWGSQVDLLEGMEMGESLSPSPPIRFGGRSPGSEACSAVTSPRGTDSAFLLSSSEEGECESAKAPPPVSPQYEELLEVMTRAVAKLNISWLAEEHAELQTSKLDECFLRAKRSPPTRSLLFFPDLHIEVSRSWASPFSARLFVPSSDYYDNVGGLKQHGYRAMPRVEQTLVSYLSPVAASSLKAPSLPSKPLRTNSALVGKGYAAAGQVGACLHTMLVLQANQADLLKEMDEREAMSSDDITELRRTADLALRSTKETARAIGRSMAAMVAAEMHLKDKDRVFLLDAPLVPLGLFGDAIESVVDRHREARRQAFQWFLPRRPPAQAAAGREQPHLRASSSYREAQRQSIATRAPPSRDWGGKWCSAPGPSKPKTDLQAVLQAKKASKKPWHPWPRAYEGSPRRRGTVFTTVPGARSSPVPSGGRSANTGAPGRSDLQWAYISVSSARKRGTRPLPVRRSRAPN